MEGLGTGGGGKAETGGRSQSLMAIGQDAKMLPA